VLLDIKPAFSNIRKSERQDKVGEKLLSSMARFHISKLFTGATSTCKA